MFSIRSPHPCKQHFPRGGTLRSTSLSCQLSSQSSRCSNRSHLAMSGRSPPTRKMRQFVVGVGVLYDSGIICEGHTEGISCVNGHRINARVPNERTCAHGWMAKRYRKEGRQGRESDRRRITSLPPSASPNDRNFDFLLVLADKFFCSALKTPPILISGDLIRVMPLAFVGDPPITMAPAD